MRSLKRARAIMGQTQDQLAIYTGVTTQTIRNLEAGRSKPFRSTRYKIEHKLGEIDWKGTFDQGRLNQVKKNN